MKALIIEDSPNTVESISLVFRLRWPDITLLATGNGKQGVEMVEQESPDIVILDIGLPDMSGFEVLRRIRLLSDVPVIILTGEATEETQKIKGFEMRADDYVLKPFSPGELVARIRNVLSHMRAPAAAPESDRLVAGSLVIDLPTRQATLKGNPLKLTPTEYRLLTHLAGNADRVLSHRNLLNTIWGDNYQDVEILKSNVYRLRRKLISAGACPDIITAERGVGYRLNPPAQCRSGDLPAADRGRTGWIPASPSSGVSSLTASPTSTPAR